MPRFGLFIAAAFAMPLAAQAQPAASDAGPGIDEPQAFRFCLDNTSPSGVKWSNFRGPSRSKAPANSDGIEEVFYFDLGSMTVLKWSDESRPFCQGQAVMQGYSGNPHPLSSENGVLAFMTQVYTPVNVPDLPAGSHAFLDQKSSNIIILSAFAEAEVPYGTELTYSFFVTPTN